MVSIMALSVVDGVEEKVLQCYFKYDKASPFFLKGVKCPKACVDGVCGHPEVLLDCENYQVAEYSYVKDNSATSLALLELVKEPKELTACLIAKILEAVKLENTTGYDVLAGQDLKGWLVGNVHKQVMITIW